MQMPLSYLIIISETRSERGDQGPGSGKFTIEVVDERAKFGEENAEILATRNFIISLSHV